MHAIVMSGTRPPEEQGEAILKALLAYSSRVPASAQFLLTCLFGGWLGVAFAQQLIATGAVRQGIALLLFLWPLYLYLDLLNRVDSALTYERELRQQWEEDLLQSCRALEDDRVKDALQTSKEAADAVVKDEPAGFSGAK